MIVHLPTPAEQSALGELNNIELAKKAYEQLETSIISQGEVLRRFRHLNADFRELSQIHENCPGWAKRLEAIEGERDAQSEKFQKLSAEHEGMRRRYEACAGREKSLLEKAREFDREREGWLERNAEQVNKINQLEEELATSKRQAGKLEADKASLTADLGQAEIVRHNLVKSLILVVFRRLMDSREYKQSLARPFSLAYGAGWLEGDGVARKPEDLAQILSTSKKVNKDALKIWKSEFEKLFALDYPFIKKIDESHRLPLGDLMNVFPDSPTPQGILGSSSRPAGDQDRNPSSEVLANVAVEENVTPAT